MPKKPTVISERVDDIPVLITQMRHMQLASLLDQHFTPHGNWNGLTPGQLSVLWLTYILSEGDHRLNQLEPWWEAHQLTLASCLAADIRRQDASDDHLAHLLDLLSDDDGWASFEQACGPTLLRTYGLTPRFHRVDSTSASGYGQVTPDGLFQFGHSKDHRPDLPQVKIKLTTLDPLGLPLVTQVVPGNSSDDPLYVPAIRQAQACLAERGVTHVGDSKMGALDTRAYIQHTGDYYLLPLNLVQFPAEALEARLAPVWSKTQAQRLTTVYAPAEAGQPREKLGAGFEWQETLQATVAGTPITWTERRLLVQSQRYAEAQEKSLRTHLAQAQTALLALNQRGRGRRSYPEQGPLQEAATALLAQHEVTELLQVTYHAQTTERVVRAYGDRPARTLTTTDYQLRVKVKAKALKQAIQRLGWRVYATNHTAQELSLPQAVLAYRQQYLEEQGFGRFKGHSLALAPMYLSYDQRVVGLIRLLSLGLRVLTLVEFEVRRNLQQAKDQLAGLYAGQPKRATARPTTELLLRAFKGVSLVVLQTGSTQVRHLTELTPAQKRILKLLKFPATLYTRLESNSLKPAHEMGEP